MKKFDIGKDLKFGDKIKIKGFDERIDVYFICYFKYGILCTNQELENENDNNNFGGTLYSCIIYGHNSEDGFNSVYYSTEYKEFESIVGDEKEILIDGKKYLVEIKNRL